MKKIPTLFRRDPDNMKTVLPEVNPECQWVIDGEGTPTRKYDGTCMLRDDNDHWWARREVKPGKPVPTNYRPVMTDPVTGKTVGWEPVEQSSFAKFHAEALNGLGLIEDRRYDPIKQGDATYELVGPKVNGNPEQVSGHLLVRHGFTAAIDVYALDRLPRDFDGLRIWLDDHSGWEGIVWHHPDGRMAKLKRRDF